MSSFDPQNIIDRQKIFFASGATLEIRERKCYLRRLKATIESYEDEIIRALKEDLGKPAFESYTSEIAYSLSQIDYAIRNVAKWSKKKRAKMLLINMPGHSYYYPRPYGCALIIAPWNYPFGLIFAPLAAALAAGNCAVLKPSEYTPATASCIKKMIADAFDPSILTVCTGGASETKALVAQNVDFIFFTGSSSIGKAVMESAARHLTPVALELGGKNPCIVDSSASVKESARRIVWGKFFNAGQTCIAPDFVCVHESILDDLNQALIDAIRRFFGKNPFESSNYGRIVNDHHVQRLTKLLQSCTPLYGGTVKDAERYIEPTVVKFDTWDTPLMEEEIFGPILPVTAYQDVDILLKHLHSLPEPLALYCFTADSKIKDKIRQRTRSGTICFNGTIHALMSKELPFGGVGNSGMGRYHGKSGFDTFSYIRSVMDKHHRLGVPVVYPPYSLPLGFVQKIQKFIM
ncbi:MAG: aldehyde dehydrogenase family protein [Chitinivibrionales bacterium]|nr:aldehyde dehydrogenase family protein [Chitinivibrionales bacterium]